MAREYRVLHINSEFSDTYKVQIKSRLGFWYNFNNIDGCTTGYYDTLDEAKDAINRHKAKFTTKVISL